MTNSLENELLIATSLVEEALKDHKERLKHSYGVMKMASYLAEKYNLNVEKAKIAAIFHDYAKYLNPLEYLDMLTDEEKALCAETKALYHAYLSAHFYLKLVGNDIEIFNAIKYHVFGRPNMSKLEEIITISDYTEENRVYSSCVKCREYVLKGLLNLALYESTLNTIIYITKDNMKPAKAQQEVLAIYKEKMKLDLLKLIKNALDKVKASNIITYDMRETSPFYDYLVIASVGSVRQADSLRGYIEMEIENTPFKLRSVEGAGTEWVLIDLYDIVVSVFTEEERERIDFEKLYLDTKRVDI